MTQKEIEKAIEGMDTYVPVSTIETEVGMPPTTLQKALSGERDLPKKWIKPLQDYFSANSKTVKKEVKKSPVKKDSEEIFRQIAAIREEVIPKHRDTVLGRKLWKQEQNKKIKDLEDQL